MVKKKCVRDDVFYHRVYIFFCYFALLLGKVEEDMSNLNPQQNNYFDHNHQLRMVLLLAKGKYFEKLGPEIVLCFDIILKYIQNLGDQSNRGGRDDSHSN